MPRIALLNCVLVTLMGVVLLGLETAWSLDGSDLSRAIQAAVFTPTTAALSFLAYQIVKQRPENLIGPGFSIIALLITLSGTAETYLHYGLEVSAESPPYLGFAAWVTEWSWAPAFLPLLTFLFLLCPDGRLPSSRWRLVAWAIGANVVLLTLSTMVSPFEANPAIRNPFRIEALGGPAQVGLWAGYGGIIPSIGLSALAMVLRFRRSTGVERLQLKWFASASVAALVLFLASWLIALFLDTDDVWFIFLGGGMALVTFAASIAILRYRLYDIDRLISRTLTYALLTAGLGATYFGVVVGLQAVLRSVSGGSDLAIVLTTLVVAALFLPARRRVQDAVDRRFNRRAYDAARTVGAFSARLREQIDLDSLRYELLAVVEETMQPRSVSLWVRGAGK